MGLQTARRTQAAARFWCWWYVSTSASISRPNCSQPAGRDGRGCAHPQRVGVRARWTCGKSLSQVVDNRPTLNILNQVVADRAPSLNRVFHALAHPARRTILRQLSLNEQNLSELSAPLKMSFPAASKHVRVLERARLVRRRVVGRSHICRLNAAPLKDVAEWTDGYRGAWEMRFQALDGLLAELQRSESPKERRHVAGR